MSNLQINTKKGYEFQHAPGLTLQARVAHNLKAIIQETNWDGSIEALPHKRHLFRYNPRDGIITASGEKAQVKLSEDNETARIAVIKKTNVRNRFITYPIWIGEIPFEIKEAVGILNLSSEALQEGS